MTDRSPVGRGSPSLKRSVAVDATGIPLATIAAPVNRHDAPLVPPLDAVAVADIVMAVHLDRGCDSGVTCQCLIARGLSAAIAHTGVPAPITAGQRWVVERTTGWTSAPEKLVWSTEGRVIVVVFWIALSAVIIIGGWLVHEGWLHYRWETRLPRRP